MKPSTRSILLAALAIALATGCAQAEPDAAAEPASLPPATGDVTGPAAGTCLEGEPDCNDTPGGIPDDLPLPQPGDDDGDRSGEGSLTVADAIAAGSLGGSTVTGFLVIDASGARLCEALAESFPPQCGGASIAVEGFEESVDVPLVSDQGVSWTDQPVELGGEIVDGTLVVR